MLTLKFCRRSSLMLLALMAGCAPTPSESFLTSAERVGRGGGNRAVTPVHQVLTPYGQQVELTGLRPQALSLSPDGKLLAVSGKSSEVVLIDPASGKILQRVALPSEKANEPQPDVVSPNILAPDKKGQLSYTGLIFSPDGRRLFLANVNGSVKVFDVATNGHVSGAFSIALPNANAPRRTNDIPAGLALSRNGRRLYVALNLSNRLGEFDAATGKLLRLFDVGVAPFDVVLVEDRAYVSNWGGGRPQPGDLTGPAGRGTLVKVDPVRFVASEGSVSVINLSNSAIKHIAVGLHSSALALHPAGRHLVCANAASDNLSVIDTRTDTVVETIWVKQSPADIFGASPNALAFNKKGDRLYVANGTQNAIAVIDFDPGASKLLGLIPVGWFPGAITFHPQLNSLQVANLKGLPTAMSKVSGTSTNKGFNTTHQYHGSLSLCPIPSRRELKRLSALVWKNYRREQLAVAKLPPRPHQPPRPVPERIGEPSVFKHVVYVIKENRTYDQVLGDDPRGNGDPALCVFGERITPNQHKLVRDFVLLDNTYCAGILSADGHQWSTTAFGTDYLERSFAGWPRSYPDGMGEDDADALAYSPAGFIWDNALLHQKSLRNYGEFAEPQVAWRSGKKGTPDFLSCYRTWKGETNSVIFASQPMIESIRPHQPTNYVGWEMNVPDQYRADFIIQELREYEARGEYPNLTIICLPNDHTSGTSKGSPTPAACVADNDLAFGRIVEAISHSKFWKETVIFAIEDDPQAGWDHVSGYRTTAYCISPYTKRGAVVGTQYNTTSLLRTMEQILGLPPMNQFDATATPMFDCFTNTPDFTPFVALKNNVPLDEMNPDPKKVADTLLRQNAYSSARLNFRQVDACPEDVLNRILWHAMKGSAAPYPAWAVTAVDEDD